MVINPEFDYSLKDVHDILKIHPRKLNRVAVKHNIKKIDNRYIFSGEFLLKEFKHEIKQLSKSVKQVSKGVKGLDIEIPTEINPFESIKEQFEGIKLKKLRI